MICINIYLNSVLRYKFLILDAYHPVTLYLCEQRCEDLWLFFEAKGARESWARGPMGSGHGLHGSVIRFDPDVSFSIFFYQSVFA